MKYLQSLNQPQKQAVEKTEGPLLVLAGAGAGKTKTITYRILHLIHKGVAPERILAITFTNKAAKEMRERVISLIQKELPGNYDQTKPFVRTFHSLGVHILRENAKLLDLPRHFSIFDRDDSLRLVKNCIKKIGHDPKQLEPRKILGAISREKGKGLTQKEFEAQKADDFFPEIVSDVWREYRKVLKQEKALDFDDLLLESMLLLKNNEDVRKKYLNIWKYIHVDEYQDTNEVQYMICKILSGEEQNICAVGDIDQNIYSWRGAKLKNILDFEKDFPGAEIMLLEENYRSTQTILTVANKIISKNNFRKEKNLFTKNEEGEKLELFSGYNESDEARRIIFRIEDLINKGISAQEIAVLYRANFQSRVLEEACLSHNISYQMIGTKFFERKEIKDVLSFLKASLNPESFSDISRIINVPPRGIGKITLLKVFENKKDSLGPAMKEKVNQFFKTLSKIKEKSLKEKPHQTILFIIKESGLENMYRKGTEEEQERLENMYELVSLAKKYDELSPEEGIEKLLEDASLATDQDDLEENRPAIKLMTVHASKGLEFDYVFVSGLEADLFPHKRLTEEAIEPEEREEERRLFYVALTRARKKVFLSYSQTRTIFGSQQVNVPSEFIDDIDEEYLETEAEEEPRDSDDQRKRGIDAIFDIDF